LRKREAIERWKKWGWEKQVIKKDGRVLEV